MIEARDLTQDDLLNALIAFCYSYATPRLMDDMHVVSGFSNRITMPSDDNDACVVTPIAQRRSGTTIERWFEGVDTLELAEYVELDVQVDCYSTNIFDARQRVSTYEAVARSSVGVGFFNAFGLDCLYADDPQNLTAIIDSAQYVSRWSVVLHLGYWKRVEVAQEFFNAVDVRVKNVDVHFKQEGNDGN